MNITFKDAPTALFATPKNDLICEAPPTVPNNDLRRVNSQKSFYILSLGHQWHYWPKLN